MGSQICKIAKMARTAVLVLSAVLSALTLLVLPGCAKGSFTKVGSLGRLYYVGSKQTWMEARNTCKRMRSRLVELWTDKQYRQLINWMRTEELVWIGLSDRTKEGVFVWDSGHALSGHVAKHWSKGEPNNVGNNEDCVEIWKHDGKSGISNGMNDRSCTTKAKFVCQKPLGSRSTCPRRYRPVCGSNGRTYRNSCFAKRSLGRGGFISCRRRCPCYSGYRAHDTISEELCEKAASMVRTCRIAGLPRPRYWWHTRRHTKRPSVSTTWWHRHRG